MVLDNISSSILDVWDDSDTMSRYSIEYAGFSNIRTADDGDTRKHGRGLQDNMNYFYIFVRVESIWEFFKKQIYLSV